MPPCPLEGDIKLKRADQNGISSPVTSLAVGGVTSFASSDVTVFALFCLLPKSSSIFCIGDSSSCACPSEPSAIQRLTMKCGRCRPPRAPPYEVRMKVSDNSTTGYTRALLNRRIQFVRSTISVTQMRLPSVSFGLGHV